MSLSISSRAKPTARRAAILAIGKPVALEASADERDTRGFISMTTTSPLMGCTANWMFEPPVWTPTARIAAIAWSRSTWYWRSVSVCWGATHTESPVWTPMGSMFSIEHTMTTLSLASRITSSSNSPQPSSDSSTSTCPIGEAARPPVTIARYSASVRATPPPQPPRVNAGRTIAGSPTVGRAASASSSPVAIFGPGDHLAVRADQLDPEALQRAVFVQGAGQVQRGLAPEGGQQGVGTLTLDHPGHRLRQERLDVGRVGELGVGHDRRRVGVDQHDLVALLPEHLAGLGAGVVELGGLADDDRPRAQQQDAPDVVAPGHQRAGLGHRIMPRSSPGSGRTGRASRAGRARPRGGTARSRPAPRAGPAPRPCGRRG